MHFFVSVLTQWEKIKQWLFFFCSQSEWKKKLDMLILGQQFFFVNQSSSPILTFFQGPQITMFMYFLDQNLVNNFFNQDFDS